MADCNEKVVRLVKERIFDEFHENKEFTYIRGHVGKMGRHANIEKNPVFVVDHNGKDLLYVL